MTRLAGAPASRAMVRRAGLGAFVAALAVGATLVGGAGAEGSGPAVDQPALPPAQRWSDHGIESGLNAERGSVRVRLILRDQSLLAAAAASEIQDQLQSTPSPGLRRAARDHPGRITAIEKDAAREAEGDYEDAVDLLQPTADQASEAVERVAAQVRRSGGTVVGLEIVPAAVIARVPARTLLELGDLGDVQAIEAAPRPKPQSSIGWQAVGAPSWFAAGYTGGTGPSDTVPADAGVSGETPDPSHPAFSGVSLDNYAGLLTDNHATHTASVLASQDMANRGVAFGLDRLVNGRAEFQLGFAVYGHPAPPDPAEVLSNSFGAAAASDDVNDGDDVVTLSFGVSQSFAASNENVDGSPTVANIGRNVMSVAGFNDVSSVASADDVVLGVSSRGPTPGGRKKPDLTAPGGAVVAADIAWNQSPPCPNPGTDPDGTCRDYTGQTGTSFSSPHVAGAMTLLEGAGITDPMAQRAILINSARDWDGTNTGLHGWTAPQTGWRPEVGWGALNLDAALAQRGFYRLGSVPEGEAAFYRATVPAGAKATLAFQMRGYFVGYPNPGTQTFTYTQSNLDLRQYRSDDSEVAPPAAFDPPDTTIDPGPDAVDPNDTVEQVRAPAADTITYKVQSASTIDGVAAEPFAIAAAAPLTPIASPTVRPDGLAADKASVRCGQPVVISTTARNDSSDLAASNAALQIQAPAGVQLVSGDATQVVSAGELATAETSESHVWTVQATNEGDKTIAVIGAGDAYGTTFRDTDQVTISADCTPPATSIGSGPSGPTNEPAPRFSFSGTGSPASFECSIDGSAFAACGSPFTAPALADGQHSFRVRAVDAVGNVDPAPPERSFLVDTQPPETGIGSGPTGTIRSQSASFTLAGGSDYECELDDGGFTLCSSRTTLSGLATGAHLFAARAIDEAGNVDPTPASRTWTVDRTISGARIRIRDTVRFNNSLAVDVKASLSERGKIRLRGVAETDRADIRARPAAATFGERPRVKLRLRARRAANRAITRALRRGPVRLVVTATFTDEAGNGRRVQRVVKLR